MNTKRRFIIDMELELELKLPRSKEIYMITGSIDDNHSQLNTVIKFKDENDLFGEELELEMLNMRYHQMFEQALIEKYESMISDESC